jgi:hypothetical protein
MNLHLHRATTAAALATAGITLVTVPAAARIPDPTTWSVAQQTQPTPWQVTDQHDSKLPTKASPRPRSRAGTSREVRRIHRAIHRRWHATTTCRTAPESRWLVGPGDTLWLITRCHPGIDIDQLRARNGIRGDRIHVGQVLVIPAVTQ